MNETKFKILERNFRIQNTPGRHASLLQLSQLGNFGLVCYAILSAFQSDCSTCSYMVAHSMTDPLNFLIFVLAFDYDRIWSGMQMKMLISPLSSL